MRSFREVVKGAPWALVAGVCGAVVGVCALLTWFRIEGFPLTGLDDYPTRSGTRRSPGLPMLLAGLAIVAASVVTAVRPRRVAPAGFTVVAASFSVLAVVWGWLAIAAYVDFEGGGDVMQPGLWGASVAAPAALASSVVELIHRRWWSRVA